MLMLIAISPIIDNINGYLLLNNLDVNISALYKTILLVGFTINLIKKRYIHKEVFNYIYIFICLMLISSAISMVWDVSALSYNFNTSIKMLMPIVFLVYLIENKKEKNIYYELIKLLRWLSWFYPISIMIPSVLGIGFHTYGNSSFGNKGFYYAGNEIGAIMIIIFAFCLQQYDNSKKMLDLVCLVINLAVDIFIGVKSVYIALIIISIIYIFKNISFRKIGRLLSIVIIICATTLLLTIWNKTFFYDFLELQIWRFNNYAIKQGDNILLNFLLSGRNTKILNSMELLVDNCGMLGILFGAGSQYMISLAGSIVEMDFLDLFLWYGAVFFSVFVVVIVGCLRRKWAIFTIYEKTMLLEILGFSCLAGHILFAPSVGIVLALVVAAAWYRNSSNYNGQNR